MKKVPGVSRTYEVLTGDFPLRIEVKAKNLDSCQAVTSDVVVKKEGVLMDPIPLAVTEDPDNLLITFDMPLPAYPPDLDLLEEIQCWFPDYPPDNSKYKVTITSATGEVERTSGSPPSINPRSIILKFYYR